MIRAQKEVLSLEGGGWHGGGAAFEGEVLCPAHEGQGFLHHPFLVAKTNIPNPCSISQGIPPREGPVEPGEKFGGPLRAECLERLELTTTDYPGWLLLAASGVLTVKCFDQTRASVLSSAESVSRPLLDTNF